VRFSKGEKSRGEYKVKEKGECEVCKLCADPTSKEELNEGQKRKKRSEASCFIDAPSGSPTLLRLQR